MGNSIFTKDEAMPKTSIITIILNGKKYIEQTIQSVLSLEYPCQEYIIMDGGSINGTVGIIKRCEKQLTCWGSTPGKRIRDGLNKGIKRATGELIKIINSDDYYAPRAINEVIDRYRRNPESDIFHGRSQTVTGSPQEWNNYPLAHSKLLYSVSISHPV